MPSNPSAIRGTAAGNPDARPSRPPNEAAVLEWFKTDEMAKNAGRDATVAMRLRFPQHPNAPRVPRAFLSFMVHAQARALSIAKNKTGRWQPWFHGMISRTDAETLLKGQPMGSFLIRISSRIWGYTLSFVDSDRFKHFLVDATDGQYSVFGAQTSRTHTDLSTLVRFHQSIAVSKTGTRLTNPVGAKTGNRSIIVLAGP